jgi:tetratricopeptide (TPR) repeat protein
MTQKRVDLNTCVWGEWHLQAMQHVMLPTLLSPGNLPALVRRFPARYRIATTYVDRTRIKSWPIFAALSAAVDIEWITDNESPDIAYHLAWYERSLVDAKARQAYCFMAYPDVAWSDGIFMRCADAIDAGKVGVAIPYIRVISETFVPEIAGRAGNRALTLSGGETVRLAMRHMHPLSVAAMAGGRHALPSLDVSWRVPDQGLLLREMSRELSMVDTTRLHANRYWNAIDTAHPQSLHVAADSDDMLMLSLAPLFKDFQVYVPNHALQPMDLARVSLHPDNNNPLVKYFAARPIRLHYDRFDRNCWRPFERRAECFVGQALFTREFLSVWQAARQAGCSLASQAMSVGLVATRLAGRWPYRGPVTVYVPTDEAFGKNGWGALESLLRPERGRDLRRVLLNHVVAGVGDDAAAGASQRVALDGSPLHVSCRDDGDFVNDAKIVRRLDLPPHQVCIIDRLLAPADALFGPPAVAASRETQPETYNRDPGIDHAATAAGFREPGQRLLSGNLDKLRRGARATAGAVAARLRAGVFLRAAKVPPQDMTIDLTNDDEIARRYPIFLRHFGVALAGNELERQKRATAAALHQAGLYRHKLLFLHDLMEQFSALGGAADPRPAFFDYCSLLIGDAQDLIRAEHYYGLALRLVPDFAESLYALGLLKRRAGEIGEAMALFEAAAAAPAHPNAVSYAHIPANSWRNLAEIHRDLGHDERAETAFREALRHHGVHGVYQAEIAEFFRARGHIADAAKQYELTMPYTHLYASEFCEPIYPPAEKLPTDLAGKPCDPLQPIIVAKNADDGQLVYWWHLYLPISSEAPFDAASLTKMSLRARLRANAPAEIVASPADAS